MLKPAILFKQELSNKFKQYYYTDDMMFETGCLNNWNPDIHENPNSETYQYAIVNKDNKIIGYLAYCIDWYSSRAYGFGLFSFERGNSIVGFDLFNEMEKLIHDYKLHRVEWRMVGGNPVEKHYDKFCKLHNGKKHILKDSIRDKNGNIVDRNLSYEDAMVYIDSSVGKYYIMEPMKKEDEQK